MQPANFLVATSSSSFTSETSRYGSVYSTSSFETQPSHVTIASATAEASASIPTSGIRTDGSLTGGSLTNTALWETGSTVTISLFITGQSIYPSQTASQLMLSNSESLVIPTTTKGSSPGTTLEDSSESQPVSVKSVGISAGAVAGATLFAALIFISMRAAKTRRRHLSRNRKGKDREETIWIQYSDETTAPRSKFSFES